MWKKYGLFLGVFVIALVGIAYGAVQYASYSTSMQPVQREQKEGPELLGGGPEGATSAQGVPSNIPSDLPPGGGPGTLVPPSELPISGEPFPPGAGGTIPSTPPTLPFIVSYDGKSYDPASIEIKKGDSVTFVNNGAGEMWPASAMHPTHAVYPTTGGCIGSTFDACAGLPAGGSWSFVFDQDGAWKYHDHLNPSARGTVNVK